VPDRLLRRIDLPAGHDRDRVRIRRRSVCGLPGRTDLRRRRLQRLQRPLLRGWLLLGHDLRDAERLDLRHRRAALHGVRSGARRHV
jgi:hypothetical protein